MRRNADFDNQVQSGREKNQHVDILFVNARHAKRKRVKRGRGDRYYGRINFRPFKVSAQDKKDEK